MECIHLRISDPGSSLALPVTRTPEAGPMCIQIDDFLLFVSTLIKLIGMNDNGDVFLTYQKCSLLGRWKPFAAAIVVDLRWDI